MRKLSESEFRIKLEETLCYYTTWIKHELEKGASNARMMYIQERQHNDIKDLLAQLEKGKV